MILSFSDCFLAHFHHRGRLCLFPHPAKCRYSSCAVHDQRLLEIAAAFDTLSAADAGSTSVRRVWLFVVVACNHRQHELEPPNASPAHASIIGLRSNAHSNLNAAISLPTPSLMIRTKMGANMNEIRRITPQAELAAPTKCLSAKCKLYGTLNGLFFFHSSDTHRKPC